MNRDRLYLIHIRDAIRKITEYTVAGREKFLSDTRTQDAVVRNFEIMGEATKRLSPRIFVNCVRKSDGGMLPVFGTS